jgi:hypothetical protein
VQLTTFEKNTAKRRFLYFSPQKLKEYTWGSSNMPPKSEWEKQGLAFHPSEQLFSYGLKCPKNGVKNFLMCLQAYFLKQLLFDKNKKGGAGR